MLFFCQPSVKESFQQIYILFYQRHGCHLLRDILTVNVILIKWRFRTALIDNVFNFSNMFIVFFYNRLCRNWYVFIPVGGSIPKKCLLCVCLLAPQKKKNWLQFQYHSGIARLRSQRRVRDLRHSKNSEESQFLWSNDCPPSPNSSSNRGSRSNSVQHRARPNSGDTMDTSTLCLFDVDGTLTAARQVRQRDGGEFDHRLPRTSIHSLVLPCVASPAVNIRFHVVFVALPTSSGFLKDADSAGITSISNTLFYIQAYYMKALIENT